MLPHRNSRWAPPFVWRIDLLRGLLRALQTGVRYLLMYGASSPLRDDDLCDDADAPPPPLSLWPRAGSASCASLRAASSVLLDGLTPPWDYSRRSFNVYFFVAVVAGEGVGEVLFGRFCSTDEDHH